MSTNKPIDKKVDIFTSDISREVYETKYKYGNETIYDTWDRVARTMASVETDKQKWMKEFRWMLEDFKFIPGGRILSNAGIPINGTTFINCFVSGFQGHDQDSMDSIFDELRRQGKILKSEGGYGFCVDVLRPRYSYIAGIGSETPGAVKMLDMWNTQSRVITEGSGKKSKHKEAKNGIRKGAQMVTMSVWHPDIEEFITAKQTEGQLEKFNMSVLVCDRFMKAVRAHKEWNLEFPAIDAVLPGNKKVKDIYKETWDGDIEKWKKAGLPVKVYKTFEDASELWEIITQSTYNRNEPGILFVDRINYWNNLYWLEHITATNPCGEQPLPVGGTCLLGSINLTQFVDGKTWNYEKLAKTISIAVRFMDNVNDITYVPLEEQKKSLQDKRRLGLGITGYGSALVMMKMRYGSKAALKLTDELMNFIMNTAYMHSALLAAEKGTFPLYDAKKYLAGNFVKKLAPETLAAIKKHGIRNSHLLTIAPTGSTSTCANVISGGCEPIFKAKYKRTMVIAHWPEDLPELSAVDFTNGTFTQARGGAWNWIKEGDENMLQCTHNGIVYKYDKGRGLTKENIVVDYGVSHLISLGQYDENADWMVDTSKLEIDEHIDTMSVLAKYIDSAMSKTINLPNDYDYGKFKVVYDKIYDSGVIKGCTTYREGTMAAVLADVNQQQQDASKCIKKTKAPKRPKVLDCDIHHFTIGEDKWVVFVGLYGECRDPYEVFAFKRNGIQISPKVVSGKIIKIKQRNHQTRYDLDIDSVVIEDVCKHFKSGEESALTRAISTALRHGADIDCIYDQLQKSEGTIVSLSKAIARAMKKYVKTLHDTTCPQCGTENALIMQEGCTKCKNCDYSRCG